MKKLIYVLCFGMIFTFSACNSGEEECQADRFLEEKTKTGSCCATSNLNDSILKNH